MRQSPRKASDGFYKLSAATGQFLGSKDNEALLIGTHTKIPFAGDAMLSERFPYESRERIVDSPINVRDRLRMHVHQNLRRYALVIAAFELHHFDRRDMQDVLELMQMLSHGAVIAGDYAFRRESPESMEPHTKSALELRQRQLYGSYDAWFNSHAVFTPHELDEDIRKPGWKSVESFEFANRQVGAIGSMTLHPSDLQTIVTSASLDSIDAHA